MKSAERAPAPRGAAAFQILTIALKDLRSELRTKEAINASLAFALVILLMFSFAFDPEADTTREISGGLLWIVFAFAGTLILNRSFAREVPNDCLDGLIAAPVPGWVLFLGKAVANFALVMAVELVARNWLPPSPETAPILGPAPRSVRPDSRSAPRARSCGSE